MICAKTPFPCGPNCFFHHYHLLKFSCTLIDFDSSFTVLSTLLAPSRIDTYQYSYHFDSHFLRYLVLICKHVQNFVGFFCSLLNESVWKYSNWTRKITSSHHLLQFNKVLVYREKGERADGNLQVITLGCSELWKLSSPSPETLKDKRGKKGTDLQSPIPTYITSNVLLSSLPSLPCASPLFLILSLSLSFDFPLQVW